MNKHEDLRASKRVPISSEVRVEFKDKAARYALAINISMGGLLLSAAPSLPVGSPCRVAIVPPGESGKKIMMEGTVVRSDANGVAVQFANALERNAYEAFARPTSAMAGNSLLNSYKSYFQVSQSKNHEGCEQLLGVTPKTFKTVFLSSFASCIPLAILPVVAFKSSIPDAPNMVKIAAAFGYAAIWFGVIQPSIDLTVFRILRNRNTNS